MKFSICIPNYNYGRFLKRTIQSVLEQSHTDFELLISDNASTDDSVELAKGFNDPRIRIRVNRCNVGFAGNLDRAARGATGDFMILLSSDDVMRPNALATYAKVCSQLGSQAEATVLCASCDQIDENDQITARLDFPGIDIWRDSDRDTALSAEIGMPAYRVEAPTLLRRCLPQMQNPFHFCATAYPRRLYEAIEGYLSNRFFGPDKQFHWRLLGVAAESIYLNEPLFGYRVHSRNQLAQQSQSGALRYLVDEYLNSIDIDAAILARAGLVRADMESAFIEYSVARHGLSLLSQGKRLQSKRTATFGRSTYPHRFNANLKAWLLRTLIALGPIGSWVAHYLRTAHDGSRSREFKEG